MQGGTQLQNLAVIGPYTSGRFVGQVVWFVVASRFMPPLAHPLRDPLIDSLGQVHSPFQQGTAKTACIGQSFCSAQ